MTELERYQRYTDMLLDFSGHIINYCVSHCESSADAADLMQDIRAALWHSIDTLRPVGTTRQRYRWLRRVMHTAYMRHLRRRLPFLRLYADPPEPMPEADNSNAALIDELAEALTADEHRLLQLYLDGYTAAEIAAQTCTNELAVRKRMQRIRQKMIQKRKEIYG